jgi:HSP20 family protein
VSGLTRKSSEEEVNDMALMRWRPMRDLLSIQEEVNRLFDEFFGKFPSRLDVFETGWTPSVDIIETKDDIVVEAELPGIRQEDINVSITDNVLTIKGEKKQEKEVKEENYHRIERSYGAFQRSFTLPTAVQADKAKASFKDGVLKVVIPKAEEAKPKEIKIEVNE